MTPLVFLLLASAPADPVSADPLLPAQVAELPEPLAAPARASVFFSPLATTGMFALGAVGPGGFYLPLGGVLSLGPHWGITGETAVGVPFVQLGQMMQPGWSFSAAVGPTYFSRDEGTDGFFVTSKLSFQVSKPMHNLAIPVDRGGGGPLPISPDTSYSFLIGVDAGYQWHVRRVTIATLLGGSIGYAYNRSQPVVTPFDWTSNRQGQGLAYAVNVDLLRIGYAF